MLLNSHPLIYLNINVTVLRFHFFLSPNVPVYILHKSKPFLNPVENKIRQTKFVMELDN